MITLHAECVTSPPTHRYNIAPNEVVIWHVTRCSRLRWMWRFHHILVGELIVILPSRGAHFGRRDAIAPAKGLVKYGKSRTRTRARGIDRLVDLADCSAGDASQTSFEHKLRERRPLAFEQHAHVTRADAEPRGNATERKITAADVSRNVVFDRLQARPPARHSLLPLTSRQA